MVGPGAQVGSKDGLGSPKLLQVEPTHTSSKQKMLPTLGKFKQSHIQNKHQNHQNQIKPYQNHNQNHVQNH